MEYFHYSEKFLISKIIIKFNSFLSIFLAGLLGIIRLVSLFQRMFFLSGELVLE